MLNIRRHRISCFGDGPGGFLPSTRVMDAVSLPNALRVNQAVQYSYPDFVRFLRRSSVALRK